MRGGHALLRAVSAVVPTFLLRPSVRSVETPLDTVFAIAPAFRAIRPARGTYLFTALTVTCEGYSREWCTELCATTPFASS